MRAHKAFTDKVLLLEQWVVAGSAPAGAYFPTGVVALRQWENTRLGLTSWSSPNLVSTYPDLKARFLAAIATLAAGAPGEPQGSQRNDAEKAQLKAHVAKLREQVSVLLLDNGELREQLELAADTIRRWENGTALKSVR